MNPYCCINILGAAHSAEFLTLIFIFKSVLSFIISKKPFKYQVSGISLVSPPSVRKSTDISEDFGVAVKINV